MIIEQQVGTFKGYDVIIRKEASYSDLTRQEFFKTAEYLKEHIFDRIDNNLQEDFEDLQSIKKVKAPIKKPQA